MKRILPVLIIFTLLLSSGLQAQDSLDTYTPSKAYKDIFGGPVVAFRMGMLMGATMENVRIKGVETNVEGFRIHETGFFDGDVGILLGLEAEVLWGDRLGFRFQPTISILEVTYYLVDPVGTTSPFNVGRSSIGLPLHIRYAPWGFEKGFYAFTGGRWRIETTRGSEVRPFELERTNWSLDAGFGYSIKMSRGAVALEATYSHGLKDQFPTSVSLASGEPDRIYHDRLLFSIVFR